MFRPILALQKTENGVQVQRHNLFAANFAIFGAQAPDPNLILERRQRGGLVGEQTGIFGDPDHGEDLLEVR